ncbi:unnamed protein product, partial [Brenthis ino]
MSWQDYVDKQLIASRCVTKAAIAGHDGNVWAKSEGFDISKDEVGKIVAGFENESILTSGGVTIAGRLALHEDTASCCNFSLRRTDPTPASCICSGEVRRLFNYLWLLEIEARRDLRIL